MTTDPQLSVRVLRRWNDFGSFAAGRDLGEATKRLFYWALETTSAFYGDEWFSQMVERGTPPIGSIWERPLTNPVATAIFVERAVRIALLPSTTRAQLADEVRTQFDLRFFHHLDLVLEVAGVALRDGWEPRPGSEPGKRGPDLRLSRPGMEFSVEITTRGFDKQTNKATAAESELSWRLMSLETTCGVELVTNQSVPILEEGAVTDLFAAVEGVAGEVLRDRKPRTVTLPGVTAVVYPAGDRPEGTIRTVSGPPANPWERVAERILSKAEQTRGSGPTWVRIDESAGLYMFSRLGETQIEDQLRLFVGYLQRVVEPLTHLRGIVLSFGAEPCPPGTQRLTIASPDMRNPWLGPVMLDRPLPGPRQRRTFVIPIQGGKRLLLPDHTELLPGRWYANEGSWLDWGLQRLGHPLSASFLDRPPNLW